MGPPIGFRTDQRYVGVLQKFYGPKSVFRRGLSVQPIFGKFRTSNPRGCVSPFGYTRARSSHQIDDRFRRQSRHSGRLCAFKPRRVSNRDTTERRAPPAQWRAAGAAVRLGDGAGRLYIKYELNIVGGDIE